MLFMHMTRLDTGRAFSERLAVVDTSLGRVADLKAWWDADGAILCRYLC